MRLTSAAPFPYGYPGSVCYIEQTGETLRQIEGRPDIRSTTTRAMAGSCRILATWPGQYHTDLFLVDDLDALAEAVGASR